MKVFKDNATSLLPRPVGFGGKLYLSLGIVLFFDLDDPDSLLSEQDLWKTAPAALKPFGALDEGYPKPGAEWLAAGSAYAATAEASPDLASGAARGMLVEAAVGRQRKRLAVFGDRRFDGASISKAEPFSVMPLVWERAYGGPGFPDNPKGKGAAPAKTPYGEVHPLPNIENPDALFVDKLQTPAPVLFGPLDVMRPIRASLAGTYDEKWLRERRPYFPDDFNPEFCRVAPPDQRLEGFFQGGEPIEIKGMHPERPVIASKIPTWRTRLFLVHRPIDRLGKPQSGPERFVEVETRRDTLWLFPDLGRGALIHRGVAPIEDDEYADVKYAYVVLEAAGDPPKSLARHETTFRELLDRTLPKTVDVRAQVNQKLARAMLKVKAAPRLVAEAKAAALGKRPVMPREPADFAALAERLCDDRLADVAAVEAKILPLHERFGHLVPIDLTAFDKARTKIAAARAGAQATTAKIGETKTKLLAMKAEAAQALKANLDPALAKQKGIDVDALTADKPKSVNPWHDRAFPLAVQSRLKLEADAAAWNRLKGFGFSEKTLNAAWPGLNPDPVLAKAADWGMAGEKAVLVPAGLVLPIFTERTLDRLVVLPDWPADPYAEFTVRGSKPKSARFGAFFGDGKTVPAAPLVAVPSLLEAHILAGIVGDFAAVLHLPDPAVLADPEAKQALAASPALVFLDHGLPEAKQSVYAAALLALNPQAIRAALPKGATVLHAKSQKLDLRDPILDAVPPFVLGLPDPADPAAQTTTPDFPDVKALVTAAREEAEAGMRARFAPLIAAKDAALAKGQAERAALVKRLLASGVDPAKLAPKAAPSIDFGAMQASELSRLAGLERQAKAAGALTPELAAKLAKARSTVQTEFPKMAALWSKGQADMAAAKSRLDEAKKLLAAKAPPPEIAAKLEASGLDVSRLGVWTRERLLAEHAAGRPLSGLMPSGLDLSGLDLSGADLSRSIFSGCDFSTTRLDRAVCQGTVFKNCALRETSFENALFKGAVLQNCAAMRASFVGARGEQAVFKTVDATAADLSKVDFSTCVFSKSTFVRARFSEARLALSMLEADFSGADFRKARLERCCLDKSTLDDAVFVEAQLPATLIKACTGRGTMFDRADLAKSRTLFCTLTAASFADADLRGSGHIQSNFPGTDFSGVDCSEALFEHCDLSKAFLAGVRAVRTRFSKCDLDGADLRSINLHTGSLRKSRLTAADLSGANLRFVDVDKMIVGGTNLDETDFHGTLVAGKTQWIDEGRSKP